MKQVHNAEFWAERYRQGTTGWDLGGVSPALKQYFDQLEDRDLRILIPGAGNAYEAEYLFEQGFKNVTLLDIALPPLDNFRERAPYFPDNQIVHQDFFQHEGMYDLVVEQTFFCAFEPTPEKRQSYAARVAELLRSGGKLVGLWWKFPLRKDQNSPPYGGSRNEYLQYFGDQFKILYFESCYNSIESRAGKEYFGLLERT